MALILRSFSLYAYVMRLCVISFRLSTSNPPFPLADGDLRVTFSDRSLANTCMLHGILSLV